MHVVSKAIQPAKEKWEKIGSVLGLSSVTLNQIKTSKHGEPGKCLYATLNAWLQYKDKALSKGVTWRALLRALKSTQVNEAALAERIKEEKGKSV